jgi:hypothetical protein
MLETTSLPRFISHATANVNLQKQLYQCVRTSFLRVFSFIAPLEQLCCWIHLLFCWNHHSHNARPDCKYQPQTSQPCLEIIRYALVFLWHHHHLFVTSGVSILVG